MQNGDISGISWREQVTFDEMMMISTLYKTNTLSWIFKYLTETTVRGYTCHPIHRNNSPWVYMSPHSLKQQSVGIHVTTFTEITVRGYTCHPIHWNNSPWVFSLKTGSISCDDRNILVETATMSMNDIELFPILRWRSNIL